jgi:hypothetical protein
VMVKVKVRAGVRVFWMIFLLGVGATGDGLLLLSILVPSP